MVLLTSTVPTQSTNLALLVEIKRTGRPVFFRRTVAAPGAAIAC